MCNFGANAGTFLQMKLVPTCQLHQNRSFAAISTQIGLILVEKWNFKAFYGKKFVFSNCIFSMNKRCLLTYKDANNINLIRLIQKSYLLSIHFCWEEGAGQKHVVIYSIFCKKTKKIDVPE